MSAEASTPKPLSALECGLVAWRLLWKAPGIHLLAGFLLFLVNEILPSLGDFLPIPFINEILAGVAALLTGVLWIGMSSLALHELAGGEAKIEHFFAPFHDRRSTPSLAFGGLIAVMMVVASLAQKPFSPSMNIDLKSIANMQISPAMLQNFSPGGMTMGLFIELLPLVFMTCYFFPGGLYVARGEMNVLTALRKGGEVMASQPWFWFKFWVVITIGDVLSVFMCLCTCFAGMSWAFAWTCLAMGAAIAAIDPSILPSTPPPLEKQSP